MPAHRTTVAMTRGGTTITLNAPEGPTNVRCLSNWVTALSESLKRWVYRTSDVRKEHWTISLHDMGESQWSDLRSFFYDVVKGPELTFTYTHTDGETYTARFVDTELQGSRRDKNTWSATITLELEGEANLVNYTASSTSTTSTTT